MRALLLLVALVLIGTTIYYTEVSELQPPVVDWSDAVEVYNASN